MPYVGRNETGAIVTVAVAEHADATEWLDASSPELQAFVADVAPATEDFSRSDQALIRVVEDIVNTLIEKNVIRFTDLPEAAQHKLLTRRSMRRTKGPLRLFGEDSIPELKI